MHALGQFQIRQVQNVARHHVFAVQLNRRRDVFRINNHIHHGCQQSHAAALQFNRFGFFCVHNVNRNAHAQRLVYVYRLEVNVLHLAFNRVHLVIAHDDILLFAVDVQFQQLGEERFFFQRVEHLFVVHRNRLRFAHAVNHGGHQTFFTQTAARTRTLRFTNSCLNLNRHGQSLKNKS